MDDLPAALRVLPHGTWTGAYDIVTLTYEDRFLRRRRLTTVHDESFLVDLPEVTNLTHGDAFELADGRRIEVIAGEEDVLVVTGDLARLAWHIGNRHTPCQIEPKRLLIRADHVLEAMLRGLGATVTPAREPFTPEVGAYGIGRTMGHDHPHGVHHHGTHGHGEEPEPDREAE